MGGSVSVGVETSVELRQFATSSRLPRSCISGGRQCGVACRLTRCCARHDALAEHFSEEEVVEIIGIAININVWTRLKLAEGATLGPAEQVTS